MPEYMSELLYKRLSELPAVDTLADLALVPVVQSGANYRATVEQIRARLAVDGHSHAVASQSAAGFMAAADKAKLDGIAASATRNDSDAALRDRASHTGTQAIATVDGLPAALDGKAPATHGHPAAAITGLAAVATSGDYADLINVPVGGGSGGPAAFRNLIVNGGCAVSHRSAKVLSNGWQVAEADLIAVKADGSVGSGTLGRQTGAFALSPSGFACQVAGVTLGSGGALSWRVRIEAKDAMRLRNGAGVFSARCWHDVGSDVSFRITVNRANAADSFATVTQIGTGLMTVPTATNADLGLALPDCGACETGLEVVVTAQCGAVTGRFFAVGALQLEAGTVPTAFEVRPTGIETILVQRYLRLITAAHGRANSPTNVQLAVAHPGMRAAPTYTPTAPLKLTDMVTADYTQSQAHIGSIHNADAHGGRFDAAWFSGLTTGMMVTLINGGAAGMVLASAEL